MNRYHVLAVLSLGLIGGIIGAGLAWGLLFHLFGSKVVFGMGLAGFGFGGCMAVVWIMETIDNRIKLGIV